MSPQEATAESAAIDAQARDWVLALASGTMDAARMQDFEQWLAQPGHRRVFERERMLWRSLGPLPRPQQRARNGHRSHAMRWSLAAAAVLAIALFAPTLRLHVQADHRTDTVVESVRLPDGSRAVLDAGSAIALRYDGHARRVELLRGRVWFDVAPEPGRPFLVEAGGGVVEDISTAFVVAREAERVETIVEQGRVRIAGSKGGDWLYLDAGQRGVYGETGHAVRLDDPAEDAVAAWRHGELLLQGVTVADAIAHIDRYRVGRAFVRGDLSGLPEVNAAFRIDRPEQALDALAATSHLRVVRLPFGMVIIEPVSTGQR